ncbi:MAG: peptidoglycan DD-metalloendopeptidase family protein [Rhizobiaceae bacterium]|nr:peptidoglycan DD-metalloendopeptidase family protein [Rhizobiaceae bacterium]
MQNARQETVFGKRREPHTVIIARGDQIRHFTVRPWVAALAGSVLAAVAIGYLLATTYLVLRDDLIGASIARQARLQHAYEDRIAALRAQVDRITSRQLLDQQLMETKVSELIARQTQLTRRHGRLDPILQRAGNDLPVEAPAPAPAEAAPADRRVDAGKAAVPVTAAALGFWGGNDAGRGTLSSADRTDLLFAEINQSLRTIENEQIDRVATLADDVDRTAGEIADALEQAGFSVEEHQPESGIGGPLIAVDDKQMFEARVDQLDEALSRLEGVKKVAMKLPIHNPAPGYPVSSSFGVRRDPLIGRPAMHAGMDFRVPYGLPVRASGAGKVVKASWNGGYGRMVEVEHADGFTTRYAHMSKISVEVGDEVQRGTIVGAVGSSGRSTGPHLHYEVRREGTAIDPLKFIKAGRKIAKLM